MKVITPAPTTETAETTKEDNYRRRFRQLRSADEN